VGSFCPNQGLEGCSRITEEEENHYEVINPCPVSAAYMHICGTSW